MKTIAAVDCEGRSAREIAEIVLDRVSRFAEPESMVRVELKEASRPVRREVESILRRESISLCWNLQVFSRSDVLATPGERQVGTGATDIRTLFDEFVAGRGYEPAFAAHFTERGRRALDDAFRAQDASAPEDGAA